MLKTFSFCTVLSILVTCTGPTWAECANGRCGSSGSNSFSYRSSSSNASQYRSQRRTSTTSKMSSQLVQQIKRLKALGYYQDVATGKWMFQAPGSSTSLRVNTLPQFASAGGTRSVSVDFRTETRR